MYKLIFLEMNAWKALRQEVVTLFQDIQWNEGQGAISRQSKTLMSTPTIFSSNKANSENGRTKQSYLIWGFGDSFFEMTELSVFRSLFASESFQLHVGQRREFSGCSSSERRGQRWNHNILFNEIFFSLVWNQLFS